MKYIRKAIALVLVAVFIAAVAIGLSVIFAVRNINVFCSDYQISSGDGSRSAEFASSGEKIEVSLSEFEGKAIAGVKEKEISSIVNASGYAEYVSWEVIYPCTINVTVRERLEMFAVPSADGRTFTILDKDCSAMTVKSSNINNLDGSPNVLVSVPEEDYPLVSSLAALFGEKFLSVRAFAESISVQHGTVEEDSLLIKLRCGLTMEIRDYKNNAEEKAKALCSAFENMADYLKLGGTMYCVSTDSGALRVVLPDGSVVA